jgi:adenylate cyclase
VIMIGPETRRLAGDRIVVRELDRLAVYGRAGGLQIYELLAMTSELAGEFTVPSRWVGLYESGLASYRARDFAAAMQHFEGAIADRSQDQPSSIMIERCKRQLELPAGDDWDDTMIAQTK